MPNPNPGPISEPIDKTVDWLLEAVRTQEIDRNDDGISGSASIPSAEWTPVLTFTPATAKLVTLFGADIGALISQNFRVRLRVGGVTKIGAEALVSTNQGTIPCEVKVPGGVAVAVEVIHGEVGAQTYEAFINYRDL